LPPRYRKRPACSFFLKKDFKSCTSEQIIKRRKENQQKGCVRDDADIKDLVRMIAKEIDSHKRDACGSRVILKEFIATSGTLAAAVAHVYGHLMWLNNPSIKRSKSPFSAYSE
jgi:hypothetical protein